MNLNTQKYLRLLEQPNNQLATGWKITKSNAIERWRCVHVHRCTQEEADGDHNVWVDVIDENGQRIAHPSVSVAFGWDGSAEQSTKFEKPAWEPGANFMLTAGERAWCAISGESDIVGDLLGENGHTSYYVVFQWQKAQTTQPPPQPQPGMISVPVDAILEVERLSSQLAAAVDRLR